MSVLKAGFNPNFVNHLSNYLSANLDKLDPATNKLLQEGALEIIEDVIYYNSKKSYSLGAGESTTNLIDTNQTKQVGITNLEKGKTGDTQFFAVGGIYITFAQIATNPANGLYRSTVFANLLPTTAGATPAEQAQFVPNILLASELSIICNGKVIMTPRLGRSFFSFNNTNNSGIDDRGLIMITPKIIPAKSLIEFNLKTPTTAVAAFGATDCVGLELHGVTLVRK